ncbi:hypothetical protein HK101_008105 [Irineochytrium annulatum]|nr:hypothetical protein HK101_008105 [Irineochytrium annulatum]
MRDGVDRVADAADWENTEGPFAAAVGNDRMGPRLEQHRRNIVMAENEKTRNETGLSRIFEHSTSRATDCISMAAAPPTDAAIAAALSTTSHRRFNPLTKSWVLCSPHRASRPWLGQAEEPQAPSTVVYDPGCYLCPRNKRITGDLNPDYKQVYTFPNDFQALNVQPPATGSASISSPLLQAVPARGMCKVICFSPEHGLTMPRMKVEDIKGVVDEWVKVQTECEELGWVKHVQVFENKGAVMGCSNPHPHGQVWALDAIPEEPFKELSAQREYFTKHGTNLLVDYAKLESDAKTRIVCENDSFLCVVPYWAVWPFETLVVPKRHAASLLRLDEAQRRDLADILKRITTRYDNLFSCSFPYSMGLHSSPPNDTQAEQYCQFHIHFYPPLLRNASVKKFLVGFEMLAEPQRDLTPEQAAERLKACGEVHYSVKG